MKKIRDEQEFRRNPQAVILSRKPAKKRCEMLDSNIKLAVIITPSSKSHRYEYYYYANGGKHLKRLGDAQTMDYYAARRACIEYSENPNPQKQKNAPKTLADVFNAVCGARRWQGETLRKRKNTFSSKLAKLAQKPIASITSEDIGKIAAQIHAKKQRAAFYDFFALISTLNKYSLSMGYIEKPLYIKDMHENFVFEEIPEDEEGYGYICDLRDLRAFIEKIMNVESQNVRNALIFGLCTALRHANIRNMGRNHLQKNEDGSYAVFIPRAEMKVKKNGDFVLGLPLELGLWLEKIAENQPNDLLFFPNPETHKPFCQATLRKNVEYTPKYTPGGKKIVVHSFRHIMSTFANEEKDDEGNEYNILIDDIERALAHKKKKIVKTYNRSKMEKTTRKVLTWWLGYLKNQGLVLR